MVIVFLIPRFIPESLNNRYNTVGIKTKEVKGEYAKDSADNPAHISMGESIIRQVIIHTGIDWLNTR